MNYELCSILAFGDGCHGLNGGFPNYVLTLVPGIANVTSFRKTVFATVIKDFEMRTSWIIQVDHKSNERCPYKSDAGSSRRGEMVNESD